uniref:hypothetical protein n=1 Tax=Mesorhizobium sp. WSM4875 TaxID=3038539 RepID=UPI0024E22935|nr:hypothetical protein [Mesorhizobium sp. WSM4875]
MEDPGLDQEAIDESGIGLLPIDSPYAAPILLAEPDSLTAQMLCRGSRASASGPLQGQATAIECIGNGAATTIATFYSSKEALTLMPSLDATYRLMHGEKQIWPGEASSKLHDGNTN